MRRRTHLVFPPSHHYKCWHNRVSFSTGPTCIALGSWTLNKRTQPSKEATKVEPEFVVLASSTQRDNDDDSGVPMRSSDVIPAVGQEEEVSIAKNMTSHIPDSVLRYLTPESQAQFTALKSSLDLMRPASELAERAAIAVGVSTSDVSVRLGTLVHSLPPFCACTSSQQFWWKRKVDPLDTHLVGDPIPRELLGPDQLRLLAMLLHLVPLIQREVAAHAFSVPVPYLYCRIGKEGRALLGANSSISALAALCEKSECFIVDTTRGPAGVRLSTEKEVGDYVHRRLRMPWLSGTTRTDCFPLTKAEVMLRSSLALAADVGRCETKTEFQEASSHVYRITEHGRGKSAELRRHALRMRGDLPARALQDVNAIMFNLMYRKRARNLTRPPLPENLRVSIACLAIDVCLYRGGSYIDADDLLRNAMKLVATLEADLETFPEGREALDSPQHSRQHVLEVPAKNQK